MVTVVDGEGPTLFGRKWLEQIQLDWKKIGVMSSQEISNKVQSFCNTYPEVFEEGLGKIHPFTADIKIDEAATPKFMKARSVPLYVVSGMQLERSCTR